MLVYIFSYSFIIDNIIQLPKKFFNFVVSYFWLFKEEKQSADDLQRSRLLGQLSNLRQTLTSSTSTSTSDPDLDSQVNKSCVSTSTQSEESPVDVCNVVIETTDTDSHKLGVETKEQLLRKKLQDDIDGLAPKERRKVLNEYRRSKDSEIASAITPSETTTLSLRFLEEVDLGMSNLLNK